MLIMQRAMAPTEKAKKAAVTLREDILAVRDEIKKIPPIK
jgi:hypothetical protein